MPTADITFSCVENQAPLGTRHGYWMGHTSCQCWFSWNCCKAYKWSSRICLWLVVARATCPYSMQINDVFRLWFDMLAIQWQALLWWCAWICEWLHIQHRGWASVQIVTDMLAIQCWSLVWRAHAGVQQHTTDMSIKVWTYDWSPCYMATPIWLWLQAHFSSTLAKTSTAVPQQDSNAKQACRVASISSVTNIHAHAWGAVQASIAASLDTSLCRLCKLWSCAVPSLSDRDPQ